MSKKKTRNGIADEQKSRVFDMFYTGTNKIADSRRSIGLGLSLCKSIMDSRSVMDFLFSSFKNCVGGNKE